MVVFDTSVVDLTEELHDPVDLLFGVQLGGGTDINRALAYCQTLVTRPAETVLVLITDLYEGGNRKAMLGRAADLTASGVNMVCLLALSDDGAPAHDPRARRRAREPRRPRLRLHPRPLPRLDGRRYTEAGPRPLGRPQRHRNGPRHSVEHVPVEGFANLPNPGSSPSPTPPRQEGTVGLWPRGCPRWCGR